MSDLGLFAQKTYLQEESEKRASQEEVRKKRQEKREDVIDVARKSFKAWLRTGVPTNLELPDPELEVEAVTSIGGYNATKSLPAQVIFRVDGMRFKVEGEYPVYERAQPWSVFVEAIPLQHSNELKVWNHLKGWFRVRSVADLGQLIDRNRVKRYDAHDKTN